MLTENFNLEFSVSATSRPPRTNETHAKDYYFLTAEEFRARIDNNEFLEWEEVYPGRFYGTLKSEVERIREKGNNVVFDVDVVGGCNIKAYYGNEALSVFIQPPSVEELRNRLVARSTDSEDVIATRVAKAEFELTFAPKFDVIVVNDELEKALAETRVTLSNFLK